MWIDDSRGPGTAFEFAFTIIRELLGKDVLKQVMDPMICHAQLNMA